MTLDVVFSPRELAAGEVSDRVVLVVDVLRATSSICAALYHGARAVIAAADAAEATRLEQALGPSDVVLAGERNMVRIPGFHLGNSPGEMTAEAVRGKTVVMTTTNGTLALLATAGAREVVVASAVNLTRAGEFAQRALERDGDLLILCAGRQDGFGLDDAYIAGCLAARALGGRRRRKGLNDAALVSVDLVSRYRDRTGRVLSLSRAGRELTALGFRGDVELAATVDAFPVLPIFHERRITLAPDAPVPA
ncbi:MAG TPA: 2-phosphosulfolactate phosphatase [Gemmatimonadales bacterium]|jgi:2-phosphosulfolactate phosphatase